MQLCANKTQKCDRCHKYVKNCDAKRHPGAECDRLLKEREIAEQAQRMKELEEFNRAEKARIEKEAAERRKREEE